MSDETLLGPTDPDPEAPTPRSRAARMIRRVAWWGGAVVVLVLLAAGPLHIHPVDRWVRDLVGHRDGHAGADRAAKEGTLWTCSMHPFVLEKQPGRCPICGMNLVPVGAVAAAGRPGGAEPTASEPTPSVGAAKDRKILFYRNPMDPTITSPVPAKDDMGMDYVPVYADQAASASNGGAEITIDPVVVQDMNVKVAPVERRDLTRRIRTVGYLDFDQEKMVSVTTKYNGFLEKVFVNYIGEPVRKGQPLFEVYSPELVQTEQELISTLDYVHSLRDATADARARADALLTAVRARLAYWDITPDQVARLEQTRKTFRQLTVVAPASGVVMMRLAGLEGMAVKPGMELLHIADISTLWLSVQIYAEQLPWVNVGSRATVTLDYLPGETFTGKVRYIEPSVSEKTRTLQVTLEVPNRERRLRAGMYATVVFQPVVARDAIVVPTQAILRTGERNVIIVALGGGQFAPRDVVLGPEGDGYTQVLSGLSSDETVVTSAQFLIDSESNLREAVRKMVEAKQAEGTGAGHAQ